MVVDNFTDKWSCENIIVSIRRSQGKENVHCAPTIKFIGIQNNVHMLEIIVRLFQIPSVGILVTNLSLNGNQHHTLYTGLLHLVGVLPFVLFLDKGSHILYSFLTP